MDLETLKAKLGKLHVMALPCSLDDFTVDMDARNKQTGRVLPEKLPGGRSRPI